jgi:hypothetical protein
MEAAGLLQEILVEEKAVNHALSELARSRSNNEALGECAATEFCSDDKDAKPLNGRRDLRPPNPSRAGPHLDVITLTKGLSPPAPWLMADPHQ